MITNRQVNLRYLVVAMAFIPFTVDALPKTIVLKPYCYCECRFETDGGVPMRPVKHDVKVQTSNCGGLALKKCEIPGQSGDGFLTGCDKQPVYETEVEVVLPDKPLDPNRPQEPYSEEDEEVDSN